MPNKNGQLLGCLVKFLSFSLSLFIRIVTYRTEIIQCTVLSMRRTYNNISRTIQREKLLPNKNGQLLGCLVKFLSFSLSLFIRIVTYRTEIIQCTVLSMRRTCGEHAVNMWRTCGEHAANMRRPCGDHAATMRRTCGDHAANMRRTCGEP